LQQPLGRRFGIVAQLGGRAVAPPPLRVEILGSMEHL
jgi:hypothetical protein